MSEKGEFGVVVSLHALTSELHGYINGVNYSKWETYRASLSNQSEQAYQQEADDAIENL